MKRLLKYKGYVRYILIAITFIITGCFYYVKASREGNERTYHTNNTQMQTESISTTISSGDNKESEGQTIFVYICGSVLEPGVVECDEHSRLYEVVEMAGGFLQEADESYLNLADVVKDGQKIYVPSKDELIGQAQQGSSPIIAESASSLIDLNKASKEQLMTLPGIGESKATDIIQYRTDKGGFKAIEDIMNISGIKEAAFNKIKELICV